MRRKTFVKEMQDKLNKYQGILDTRILVRLHAGSIQHTKEFQSLDQNVQALIVAVGQGQNAVAALLADHSHSLRSHIDRRFDDHAQRDLDRRSQQQFKDSLFFPGIFSRQEQIREAHLETCCWIFCPPRSEQLNKSKIRASEGHNDRNREDNDRHPSVPANDQSQSHRQAGESNSDFERRSDIDFDAAISDESNPDYSDEHGESLPWSNFIEWLEHGQGAYWLKGKPGSGKSTLTKYLVSEVETNA